MAVLNFATLGADHLTALLSAKDTLKEILASSGLQSCLKSIEEKIEELLGILLLGSVSGTSIELFEGEAKAEWVVVHTI